METSSTMLSKQALKQANVIYRSAASTAIATAETAFMNLAKWEKMVVSSEEVITLLDQHRSTDQNSHHLGQESLCHCCRVRSAPLTAPGRQPASRAGCRGLRKDLLNNPNLVDFTFQLGLVLLLFKTWKQQLHFQNLSCFYFIHTHTHTQWQPHTAHHGSWSCKQQLL